MTAHQNSKLESCTPFITRNNREEQPSLSFFNPDLRDGNDFSESSDFSTHEKKWGFQGKVQCSSVGRRIHIVF